jgi:isopenicillin-N N-acyltransferase-like protein
MTSVAGFPIVKVTGTAYERGEQLGKQAKEMIKGNVSYYMNIWSAMHIPPERVVSEANKFLPIIERYDKDILEEMKGVAAGADLSLEEIVALNSRWELVYINLMSAECTAVSLDSEATNTGHTIIAQNWDYMPAVRNNCVLLIEMQEPEYPNLAVHTEAGILGHKGMNSEGLGLVVNGLASDRDKFEPKVPFLVMVRKILNQRTLTAALSAIAKAERSVSGNIMLAQAGGVVFDVECTPNEFGVIYDSDGVLAHANTFCDTSITSKYGDKIKTLYPDSIIRIKRADKLMRRLKDKGNYYDAFTKTLTDHFGRPNSVCRHEDPSIPINLRSETLSSIIMDLDDRTIYITNGPPCSNPYEKLELSELKQR